MKNVPRGLHVTCKSDGLYRFFFCPPPLTNVFAHYVTAPGRWAPWNVCPPPPPPPIPNCFRRACICVSDYVLSVHKWILNTWLSWARYSIRINGFTIWERMTFICPCANPNNELAYCREYDIKNRPDSGLHYFCKRWENHHNYDRFRYMPITCLWCISALLRRRTRRGTGMSIHWYFFFCSLHSGQCHYYYSFTLRNGKGGQNVMSPWRLLVWTAKDIQYALRVRLIDTFSP